MTDDQPLSDDEARPWFERFGDSTAVEQLFEAADDDIAITRDALEREHVVERGEHIHVSFVHEADEGDYVRVTGKYDAEDGTLDHATLDDGYVAAPLAGHGTQWEYRDGGVEKRRWVS